MLLYIYYLNYFELFIGYKYIKEIIIKNYKHSKLYSYNHNDKKQQQQKMTSCSKL